MHIFNISETNLQRIKKKQWKPYEKLISQSMHFQPLLYVSNSRKMAKLKNAVNLSKTIFSAL